MRTIITRTAPFVAFMAMLLLVLGCERFAIVTPVPQLQRSPSATAEPSPSPTVAPPTLIRPTQTPLRAFATPWRPTVTPPTTPYPQPPPSTSNTALVEEIRVDITESRPVRVSVMVKGHLPDGCTRIASSTVKIEVPLITITLRTERPQEAFCTLALIPFEVTLPLDVQRLAPGAYIVDVQGVRETLIVTSRMLAPQSGQSACQPTRDGLRGYTSIANRYCLLYPEPYYTFRPEANLLLISGKPRSDVPRPLQAQLSIRQAGRADGRSIETLAKEQLQKASVQDSALIWSAFTLGGEEGVMVDGVPDGEATMRQGYIVHDGVLYVLSLSPISSANSDATSEALALWKVAIDSFVFLD